MKKLFFCFNGYYSKFGTQCVLLLEKQQYRDPAGLCVVVSAHKVFGLCLDTAELRSVVLVVSFVYHLMCIALCVCMYSYFCCP